MTSWISVISVNQQSATIFCQFLRMFLAFYRENYILIPHPKQNTSRQKAGQLPQVRELDFCIETLRAASLSDVEPDLSCYYLTDGNVNELSAWWVLAGESRFGLFEPSEPPSLLQCLTDIWRNTEQASFLLFPSARRFKTIYNHRVTTRKCVTAVAYLLHTAHTAW